MSNQNNGGSAFPQHGWTKDPEVLERMRNQGGMTLRDWFAGQVLQGMAASSLFAEGIQDGRPSCTNPIAESAYAIADAMLKARGGAA